MAIQKNSPKITTTVLRRIQELLLIPDDQVEISDLIMFGQRYSCKPGNKAGVVAREILVYTSAGSIITDYDAKYALVADAYKRLKELKLLCKRIGILFSRQYTDRGHDATIGVSEGKLYLRLTSEFSIRSSGTKEIFEKDLLRYSRIVNQPYIWMEKCPLLQPYEYYDINDISEPIN